MAVHRMWRCRLLCCRITVVVLLLLSTTGVADAVRKKDKKKGKKDGGVDKKKKVELNRKIDMHQLHEDMDKEDPEEEAVWETKRERKRRLAREKRQRNGGHWGPSIPADGEALDPEDLQDLIKGATMGGGGMGGMGGMGGGATIKSMSAYLARGLCDGSLPPQIRHEPMKGKECAEKHMNKFAGIVATGGIPSLMQMATDNSSIMYVYNGLDQILKMGQMREFLLTREEVAYVQADTTRYWPNGEKEEKTTDELKAENKARKVPEMPTRKLKKKEVERLKRAEEAAKERRQRLEKERTSKQQAKELEEAKARLEREGKELLEDEREELERTVERLEKTLGKGEVDGTGSTSSTMAQSSPPPPDDDDDDDDERDEL
jgi:hypothetical protein